MTSPLDDPRRVAPELAVLVRAMLADPRPAYAAGARAAIEALEAGTLVGIQRSSSRDLLATVDPRAVAVAAEVGALCQCLETQSPPGDEGDLLGWIVTQDGFAGGAMVLVHEISHFRNRFVVWQMAQEHAPLLAQDSALGIPHARIRWVRAQLLNEIAARHTAFLAEEGRAPGGPMPTPAAFFACAVKIAGYPAVYNDVGVMARVVARRDPELLRMQVASWLRGLERFAFFAPDGADAGAHAAWLTEVVAYAEGGGMPAEIAEGTL